MKRFLISLIACVCVSIGAWAEATFSNTWASVTITTNGAGNITAEALTNNASSNFFEYRNFLKIVGEINSSDIANLAGEYVFGAGMNGCTIDFSEATIVGSGSYTAKSLFKGVALPADFDFSSYSGSQTFAYYLKDGDVYLHIFDSTNGVSDFVGLSQSNSWANSPANNKKIYLSGAYGDFETAKTALLGSSGAGATDVIKVVIASNDPYTFDGCDVTINLAKAEEGQTLADLIALAKKAMTEADATQTSICTLTVSGELSSNDITVALSSSDMAGATRIDLSGATLASGVILTSLNIPSSLTSLVLPKGETVSSGLATKLADTNLIYAYSPTSSDQDASQAVADYVWVNEAGGMYQALDKEAMLKTSHYIKVASSVVLNSFDMDYSGHNITGLEYLDLSDANLIPSVSETYKKPHDNAYRIILPNNRTADQMAIYAANTNAGSLAAVYSYEGTKLKVLEINDDAYIPAALSNPKIVHEGTTALEVVSGQVNGTHYGQFGNPNSSNTPNILTGINGAASSIKTVILNNVWTQQALTFTNTNITELQIIGARMHYNDQQGTAVNVDGCTALTKLSITDSKIASLDASVATLSNVSLAGTSVAGAVDLSNSGVATFTNATKVTGNLNLTNTKIVNFAATGEVDGDIIFNASTNLATIDLTSITLGQSSKIHIHKTDSESDNDVLDNLNIPNKYTITVPNGFVKADRIHPYSSTVIDDNIAEVAAASGNTDGDGCSITYDSATKIATVHATTAGHFANLMATNYSGFPIGTTFKFDAESKINENDLKALAGTIIKSDGTQSLDAAWRSNYYYVDLFDIKADKTTCDYQTGEITKAIEWMRTNNRQFKGLILPEDHTIWGNGTTLIKDADGAGTPVATCSEFIAYYETKNEDQTDATKKMTVAHVYNQSNSSDSYQASFDKMSSLLRLHDDVTGANSGKGTDVFLVSTNSINKLNIDNMVANASSIEVVNNEMVASTTEKASIYVYPKVAGDFTEAVTATALYNTPTELLKIEGPISSGIATALNKFTNGPRVLDLKDIDAAQATDEFLSTLLAALTNSHIEYIILPEGMQKSTVCRTYASSMTSLKAVISSSATNLVAHVQQPGSLAQARYYATGGAIDGTTYTPTVTGLQSVTLSGFLDASDILANTTTHFVSEQGHWIANGSNAKSVALNQEQGTITTIDLKDAVFPTQEDMNFSYAGLSSLKNVTLPTSPSMTLICDECFMGIASLTEICVPYYYTKFGDAAFHNSSLDHLTTTDANGALIDNGPKTFTFSKNVEEIGNKPATADKNGVYSLSRNVFAHNTGVTDVYVLAHKVPKCYAHSFPANMLYGWGGFKGGDYPYCREKYDNSSDGSMIFTVLHFPDEASFNASTDKEDSYKRMKALYTDITKIYTKKEQTGAVDANGDAIAWPTFTETRRVYNQATNGIIWDDWKASYDSNHEVNGAFPLGLGKDEVAAATAGGNDQGANHNPLIKVTDEGYNFTDYEGWHQFVLSMATYVEPDKTVVNDVVKNTYVKGPWYTLCIPFSLTVDQACEILGVPASVEGVEENYLDGEMIIDNTRKLPDVRTLQTVTRKPGKQNEVTLKFTQNLVTLQECRYWNINDANPISSDYAGTGNNKAGERIAIRGGYPYLVQPYLPQGVVVKNLGKYIMTKFASDFKQELSCIYVDGCAQDLAAYTEDNKTGRFAKPFERHKIQAALDVDGDNKTDKYDVHADNTKYYYTFVGQFWDQPLPRYAFYMVETNDPTNDASIKNSERPTWYRYTSGTKDYKWNKYKCIIMATQEVKSTDSERSYLFENSGHYRNNEEGHSFYPASTGTDSDGGYKFDKSQSLYIEFLNGRDDAIFDETASARYVIEFDDAGVQEIVDDDSAVTAISSLDGEDIMPTGKSLKVYNVAGQYVGQSLDGLAKGMYIVNGKKVLVK